MSDKKPMRQFKANPPKSEYQGSEGLTLGKDGTVIRDDTWLHPEAGLELLPTHPNHPDHSGKGKHGDSTYLSTGE